MVKIICLFHHCQHWRRTRATTKAMKKKKKSFVISRWHKVAQGNPRKRRRLRETCSIVVIIIIEDLLPLPLHQRWWFILSHCSPFICELTRMWWTFSRFPVCSRQLNSKKTKKMISKEEEEEKQAKVAAILAATGGSRNKYCLLTWY